MRAIRKSAYFILFIAGVSALAHYCFSWIGFNPTDEGFVLSAARRVLDGQVPHVDFATLRPAGSAYVHALIVKYGGDQVFYLSRLVFWVQSAVIAWMWVVIADKVMKLEINIHNRFMLAVVVLLFNTHNFPPMAWTTVDGLFFASIGIWLITHFSKNGNQLGYLLLGCAALCKQNFLVLIPGVFIIMGHFRRPYYLLDGFTPVILYSLLLWRNDGLDMMMDQVFARREIVETGIRRYLHAPGFFVGVALPLCINAFRKKYKGFLKNIDFILAFDLVLLAVAAMAVNIYVGDWSFALFGFLLGYTVVHIKKRGHLMYNSLALLMAWTTSISLGYNTPALASGIILAALLASNYDRELFSLARKVKYPIAAGVMILTLAVYSYNRLNHVYKDAPAAELTTPLEAGLKGGAHILTNDTLVQSLQELDSLQGVFGDSLVIVPDYAAFWVTSPYPNPLNMDWPNISELDSEKVQSFVRQHLIDRRGSIVIAVEKYRASELYAGRRLLEDADMQYPIVDIVETDFMRMNETEYFYIYR